MKEYPQRYERVHTSARSLKRCKLSDVTTDIGVDVQEYIKMIQDQAIIDQAAMFEGLVKDTWIFQRFYYKGKQRKVYSANGKFYDLAFSAFMKTYVGFDAKMLTKLHYAWPIASYFKDWFPDFDIYNPLKDMDDYQYPYDTATLEYAIFVYQMPERLELLEHAEKNKMGYSEFRDYVYNYVESYNAEHGKTFAISAEERKNLPYIIYIPKTKNKVLKAVAEQDKKERAISDEEAAKILMGLAKYEIK